VRCLIGQVGLGNENLGRGSKDGNLIDAMEMATQHLLDLGLAGLDRFNV